MTSKLSLVEQKKLQWAKEKEEMARLTGQWDAPKHHPQSVIRTNIRTYPSSTRLSSREVSGTSKNKPFRAVGHYGSTTSLQSLVDHNNSANTTTSLRALDFSTGSLVNLLEETDFPGTTRRRSPSLPPIYTKDNRQNNCHLQENTSELGVEGLRYNNQPRPQKHHYRQAERNLGGGHAVQHCYEEREGETSGYASDSAEAPVLIGQLEDSKRNDSEMSERTWQNPYCETPETSLPPSRRLSITRLGELNRPRWGSIWGQESGRTDPPPPSWLERGLSRLGNSSQVLVINHDSASSPDSSTTGSTGSDSKTYIRGQNIPMDAQVLQEREVRRQRALELQNAIKQQLEEKDRQRKAERERKLREEIQEEERIKRERDQEKERFEEEQRRTREKELAKLKKEQAMREILETAEREAKEEKRKRRQREEPKEIPRERVSDSYCWDSPVTDRPRECASQSFPGDPIVCQRTEDLPCSNVNEKTANSPICRNSSNDNLETIDDEEKPTKEECYRGGPKEENTVHLPVSKEVAIVLSGRLEDPEFLNNANLQLVNLVVSPGPRKNASSSTNNAFNSGLNALVKSLGNPVLIRRSPVSPISPRFAENRVLTPSKYRYGIGFAQGRDFGTQTDCESEIQDSGSKESFVKERKDVVNNNRREVEKSTNTGPSEDSSLKVLVRSKSQPRTTLESRPRWNANRPGTRYRTQSEKDPHYQRRMRLRRRRVESSDERSRSPSPNRRKSSNQKSKNRNSGRRKVKIDSYDADLSMDSLNSVVPLRVDEHGRITILHGENKQRNKTRRSDDDTKSSSGEKLDVWCGQEILSQLASLRNNWLLQMAFQLDDLLKDDKKDGNLIPDLSKATCNSQEEYRRLHERCPEYKIKPEKIKKDDMKVRDKDFSWRTTKKELKAMDREWLYGDPIPPDMRSLNLQELQQVPIDWRMLTPLRPKLRADEDMFSRLVEMGKLEVRTLAKERRISVSPIRRSKNRSGIIESSVKICGECGEEYCFGESCGDIMYESFTRVTLALQQPKVKVSADTAAIIAGMNSGKRKRKKKGKRGKIGVPAKKSARMGIRSRKTSKSETKSEASKIGRGGKGETENGEESGTKVKKFKRKCSKNSKKADHSPK